MRIALDQHGEVAMRTGRILLGERNLLALGLIGRRPNEGADSRMETVGALSSYTAVVSDDPEPRPIVERALEAGISCVLWVDGQDVSEYHDRFVSQGTTLLVGGNLGEGIAPSLTAHASAESSELLGVECAWTEPGKPHRRGHAVPFPDPVGSRWAKPVDDRHGMRRFVARTEDEWAGAMVKVTVGSPDGVNAKIVGVADLAIHLEAIALAAAVASISEFPYGHVTPPARSRAYLDAALGMGLGVAAYTTRV